LVDCGRDRIAEVELIDYCTRATIGRIPSERRAPVSALASDWHSISMPPGSSFGALRLAIKSARGDPIPGAVVRVKDRETSIDVGRADKDGIVGFSFAGNPGFDVVVLARGYEPAKFELTGGTSLKSPQAIVLRPCRPLCVRVMRDSNQWPGLVDLAGWDV